MIRITDKHLCCGCSACIQSCPRHCITMQDDEEGFLYPQVQVDQCCNCGLCEKVCPVLNQERPYDSLEVYAAKNKNEDELMQSSSGGLFILLAKQVLYEGGVVFGVKFDENWDAIHAYAETEEEVKQFMGSKYVQSRIGNTYQEAKDFLMEARQVLYSGTPCQIAGLKKFLRKDYDNLLTVDIICHGVPSPKVWHRYLGEIKKNALLGGNSVSLPPKCNVSDKDTRLENIEIKGISFRDKSMGWKKYCFTITLAEALADGKQNTVSLSHPFYEDSYMKLFLRNFILRPSCYHCPSKLGKSRSDITIADFWGIEEVLPEYEDTRGVGLLMINSNRGKKTFNSINLSLKKVSVFEGVINNSSYYSSVNEPIIRDKCFQLLDKKNISISKVTKVLDYYLIKYRIILIIKKLLRR